MAADWFHPAAPAGASRHRRASKMAQQRSETPQDALKRARRRPKTVQEGLRDAPRALDNASDSLQTAQEVPKTLQVGSKKRPKRACTPKNRPIPLEKTYMFGVPGLVLFIASKTATQGLEIA